MPTGSMRGEGLIRRLIERLSSAPSLEGGSPSSFRQPLRKTTALNDPRVKAAGTTSFASSDALQLTGRTLRMAMVSHASAKIEVAFTPTPQPDDFVPMVPGSVVRRMDGGVFREIYMRKFDATVPTTTNTFTFVVDDDEPGDAFTDEGRFAQVSPGGSQQQLMELTTQAGTEVPALGTPAGSIVVGGIDDTGTTRDMSVDGDGHVDVNPIDGQTGVAGGAGVNGANVQRATLATDDATAVAVAAAKADLDTLAGIVTAARAAVNAIAGQAGIDGGAGASTAKTTRVILSTDSPVPSGNGTPASSAVSAERTTSGQLVAAAANLRADGFSVRETAGAAALIVIHHGVDNTGPPLFYVNLAANTSAGEVAANLQAPNGIFLEIVSGSVKCVAYSKVAA